MQLNRLVLVLLAVGMLVLGIVNAQIETQPTNSEVKSGDTISPKETPAPDEKALPIKTITSKEVTSELLAKTKADFDKRANIMVSASVDSAKIDKEIIITSSSIVPRESGGITSELFCQDNVGHFMPIWGHGRHQSTLLSEITLEDTTNRTIAVGLLAKSSPTTSAAIICLPRLVKRLR